MQLVEFYLGAITGSSCLSTVNYYSLRYGLCDTVFFVGRFKKTHFLIWKQVTLHFPFYLNEKLL